MDGSDPSAILADAESRFRAAKERLMRLIRNTTDELKVPEESHTEGISTESAGNGSPRIPPTLSNSPKLSSSHRQSTLAFVSKPANWGSLEYHMGVVAGEKVKVKNLPIPFLKPVGPGKLRRSGSSAGAGRVRAPSAGGREMMLAAEGCYVGPEALQKRTPAAPRIERPNSGAPPRAPSGSKPAIPTSGEFNLNLNSSSQALELFRENLEKQQAHLRRVTSEKISLLGRAAAVAAGRPPSRSATSVGSASGVPRSRRAAALVAAKKQSMLFNGNNVESATTGKAKTFGVSPNAAVATTSSVKNSSITLHPISQGSTPTRPVSRGAVPSRPATHGAIPSRPASQGPLPAALSNLRPISQGAVGQSSTTYRLYSGHNRDASAGFPQRMPPLSPAYTNGRSGSPTPAFFFAHHSGATSLPPLSPAYTNGWTGSSPAQNSSSPHHSGVTSTAGSIFMLEGGRGTLPTHTENPYLQFATASLARSSILANLVASTSLYRDDTRESIQPARLDSLPFTAIENVAKISEAISNSPTPSISTESVGLGDKTATACENVEQQPPSLTEAVAVQNTATASVIIGADKPESDEPVTTGSLLVEGATTTHTSSITTSAAADLLSTANRLSVEEGELQSEQTSGVADGPSVWEEFPVQKP